MNRDECLIKYFVMDVDGVLTDGSFWYSKKGKILKKFGSHDAQAIKIGRNFFDILAITADAKGFAISKKRCKDLGIECFYVPEGLRSNWIRSRFKKRETAFIGDSFSDIPSLLTVQISFAPANAFFEFKKLVTHRLKTNAGEGAVAEAIDYLVFRQTKKHIWDYEF